MNLLAIVAIVAYAAVGSLFFRSGFRWMLEPPSDDDGAADLFIATTFGLLVAAAWPVILAGRVIERVGAERVARAVGGETDEQRIDRMQARITQLEREIAEGDEQENDQP